MIIVLTALWIIGIIFSGLVLVRVRVPTTFKDEFIVGLIAIGWPIAAAAVFVTGCCKMIWKHIIDEIILAMRASKAPEAHEDQVER